MEPTWAIRIRDLEALGWSLTGLGEVIGLSAQGVSDIKQGRTKAPTGMAAVRLHRLHQQGQPPASAAEVEAAPVKGAA